MNEETQIAKLNLADKALAQASTIEEIQDIKIMGEAILVYAEKKKLSFDIITKAQKFLIDAEIKIGESLISMEKNTGSKKHFAGGSNEEPPKKLSEMGVSKKDSANAQKLAKNKDKVDEIVKEKKEKKEPISKAAILKEISPEPKRRNTSVQASFNVMTDTFSKHVLKVQKDIDRFTPTAFQKFLTNDLVEIVRVLESWKNPTLDCVTCNGTGSYTMKGTSLSCDRCIGGKVGLSLFMAKGK
jgi:hypothetical protein